MAQRFFKDWATGVLLVDSPPEAAERCRDALRVIQRGLAIDLIKQLYLRNHLYVELCRQSGDAAREVLYERSALRIDHSRNICTDLFNLYRLVSADDAGILRAQINAGDTHYRVKLSQLAKERAKLVFGNVPKLHLIVVGSSRGTLEVTESRLRMSASAFGRHVRSDHVPAIRQRRVNKAAGFVDVDEQGT